MKRTSCRIMITLVSVLIVAGCLSASPVMAESNTPVNVIIGETTFKAVFYNNETSKALLKKFPLELTMSELNGNEKYKYLPYDLPTDEQKVNTIQAGDIMLYGSDCLVLFYRSFDTKYPYTRVGRITSTKGLKKAVGSGSVTVKWKKRKSIRLSKTSLSIEAGTKKTIRLIGALAKKVRWRSSNKSAATVYKGTIKGRKAGTATITALYKAKKYKCKVKVHNPADNSTGSN